MRLSPPLSRTRTSLKHIMPLLFLVRPLNCSNMCRFLRPQIVFRTARLHLLKGLRPLLITGCSSKPGHCKCRGRLVPGQAALLRVRLTVTKRQQHMLCSGVRRTPDLRPHLPFANVSAHRIQAHSLTSSQRAEASFDYQCSSKHGQAKCRGRLARGQTYAGSSRGA